MFFSSTLFIAFDHPWHFRFFLPKRPASNDPIYASPECSCNFAAKLSFELTELVAQEATFHGNDYVTFRTPGDDIVSLVDEVSLRFKTEQADGLLFFTGKSRDSLVCCDVMKRHVCCRFRLESRAHLDRRWIAALLLPTRRKRPDVDDVTVE